MFKWPSRQHLPQTSDVWRSGEQLFREIQRRFAPLVRRGLGNRSLRVHRPNGSYEEYLRRQKEKTTDPKRIEKWQTEEWEIKLEGFRRAFAYHESIFVPGAKALCLGARTGQEVAALWERGVSAVGIDLVPFAPFTVEGDMHNMGYADASFDVVFTNVFDHTPAPSRFVGEIERVLVDTGYAILHLQVSTKGDVFSENDVVNVSSVQSLFCESTCVARRRIRNSHDNMDWELVMRRNVRERVSQ